MYPLNLDFASSIVILSFLSPLLFIYLTPLIPLSFEVEGEGYIRGAKPP